MRPISAPTLPAPLVSDVSPNPKNSMAIIAAGADAPDFELDSHDDKSVKLSSFAGNKNVMLVFYPLDWTPT